MLGCVPPEEDDGAAWAILLRKNRFSPGVRKISSEVQKSSCIIHRCTVYNFIAKKETKWHVGRGRSGDVSCRKKGRFMQTASQGVEKLLQ